MRPEDNYSQNAEPNSIGSRSLDINYYRQKGMPKGQINASYYTQKGSGVWLSSGPGGKAVGGTINITPNVSLDLSSAPGEKMGTITYRKKF
jgi:hypothetical protein